VRAGKPPAEDEGGEGEPFALEKLVNVTRRHALAPRDRGSRQIAIAEVRIYVGDDRPQPRGADAAPLGDRPTISRGAYDRCDQIVDMGDDKPLEVRCLRGPLTGNGTRVGDEQVQHLRAVRDDPERRVVEPTDECCNSVARYAKSDEAHRRWTRDRKAGGTPRSQHCVAVL